MVVEQGRATGVEIPTRTGRQVVRAEREVIVSAGVYGSPQLLMLSGLGPADQLRAFGLDVRADLPVGENLHDHLFVPMSFAMPSALHRPAPLYFGRAYLREQLRHGSTWLARSVFEVVAFVRTEYAGEIPDLQRHVLPWSYPSPNQDAPIRHQPDLDVLVNGMELIRETMAAAPIAAGGGRRSHRVRPTRRARSWRRRSPSARRPGITRWAPAGWGRRAGRGAGAGRLRRVVLDALAGIR